MEIWKTIEGYDSYEISNKGNVRNKCTGKILIGDKNNMGYRRVALHNEFTPPSKGKREFVHRLVAKHFVDGYQEGLVVNHLDGNKLNNDASNLEWTTKSGNDLHAFKTGLRETQRTCKGVYKLDAHTEEILEEYPSIKEASIVNGFDDTGICRACKNPSKIYKGYK